MEPSPPFNSPEQRERSRAFGARFRQARESAGCSVRSLAQATRISVSFIEALEEGAFERLPGEVFGRGFVRSICKALSLDANEMISAFDECWDHSGPSKSVLEVEIKEKPFEPGMLSTLIDRVWGQMRGRPAVLRTGVGALVVIVLGLIVWQIKPWRVWPSMTLKVAEKSAVATASSVASATEVSRVVSESAQSQSPAESEQAARAEVTTIDEKNKDSDAVASDQLKSAKDREGDGHQPAVLAVTSEGLGEQILELTVTDVVRVRSDVDGTGSRVKEYTPGSHQIRFKDHVEMMVYDAAAVKISFNGRPLGSLGAKGRVRRISFQSAAPDAKKF